MDGAAVIEVQADSNENGCHSERLYSALENRINSLEPIPLSKYRIKRIPHHLREVNDVAYTPKVISIGPFHHFDKKLLPMEEIKWIFCKEHIARANVSWGNLESTMSEMGDRICHCYAEAESGMGRDDFLEIILVDAIFILELMFQSVSGHVGIGYSWIADLRAPIDHDLLLLENQLPFFVLDKLYNLNPEDSNRYSLIDLTFRFFEGIYVRGIPFENVVIRHFIDLVRISWLPQRGNLPGRIFGSKVVSLTYSATQLSEAGVKFKVNSSECLCDISFDFRNGVLEMPCLELFDGTEAVIRNVMAFEQYCFGDSIYVSDYFFFLDGLVNTSRDIDLLCDNGIIRNCLGDNEAAASLVNKLNIYISMLGVNPNHNPIFRDLNEFYKKPWHKWRATLRHQYFSTPWRIASTVAAITLLVFTFIQTVCSIIQLRPTG